MKSNRKISGGIYLVLDPSMNEGKLLEKLTSALEGDEIAAVQIWDNFPASADNDYLVNTICQICHRKEVPVFVNNRWQLLESSIADGVHFDEIPENMGEIKSSLDRDFQLGITCNNDLSIIKWADENHFDYVSFCSVFPSSTSNSCELVDFEVIRTARKLTSIPIFLAGGIKPENIDRLQGLEFDGVAVISGIMNSDDPAGATKDYYKLLLKQQK